jgi:hypothetical protein
MPVQHKGKDCDSDLFPGSDRASLGLSRLSRVHPNR